MQLDQLPRLNKAVGTLVILSVMGLWAWSQYQGQPLDMVWQMAVLVIVIASGYVVFGPKAMTEAVDDAKELQSEEDENADEESA